MPDRASSEGRAIRQATCDYYNRSKSSIYNQKNATGIRVGSIFLLSANDVEICLTILIAILDMICYCITIITGCQTPGTKL